MKRQQIVRVGAIVAVAGMTGFVMQSQGGEEPPAPRAAASVAPPVAPGPLAAAATPLPGIAPGSVIALSATESEDLTPAGPGMVLGGAAGPVITGAATPLVPADPFAAPAIGAAPPAAAMAEAEAVPPAAAEAAVAAVEPVAECTQDMALIAQPGAMLDLGLLAPCALNERVTIRHDKLAVTGRTSTSGTLIASIPALSSPASVTIVFADGTEVTQTVEIPDLADFDRFAVQWPDQDAFQLQALARGARLGEPGNVSAAAPGKASATGNFLSIIGDDAAERPLLAEVYTWPAGTPALSGKVDLTIEAAVTETTCGREIIGETIQLTRGKLLVRELSIEMPGCEAIGEFVALQNPVAAEKLAAR